MTILIADDEKPAREKVLEFLRLENFHGTILEAGDGYEAVRMINGHPVDIVFLDIQMPGMGGFDVIEAVGEASMPVIVFVTAYDKYALAAFEVQAVDYLLKPYNRERFSAGYRNALSRVAPNNEDPVNLEKLLASVKREQSHLKRIAVNDKDNIRLIKVEDIRYMAADDKYVELHTAEKTYIIRDTIKRLEKRLDPTEFARIHRSYIVRIDEVSEVRSWFHGDYMAVLPNGDQLPVSRRYRSSLITNT